MILASIIFFNINLFISNLNLFTSQNNPDSDIEFEKQTPTEERASKDDLNTSENNKVEKQNEEWLLEIPSIGVSGPIADGTTNEVIDSYIGHFNETVKTNGNIGLVAHNRGYPHNYFENLKKLKIGDIIIYTYHGKTIKYRIEIITIIKDTDWSYLQSTKDNRITLITCVENQPEYRRCIQGVEMEENKIE